MTVDGFDAGGGVRTAGSQSRFVVAGRGGVPDDAIGVIANVTGVKPFGNGYMTVHGCVEPMPLAASLNYTRDVNLGDEVVVALNGDGELCVFTSADAHLTIDVVGYVPAGSTYHPLAPARLLDTRPGGETIDGVSAGVGASGANGVVEVKVAGRGGVAADARAVMVYVAAVRGAGAGFLTVWDCDAPMPLASSLNFVADTNRGNEVVATPGTAGSLCVFSSTDVDVTVDVVGYLPAEATDFVSIVPTRFLDTREAGETTDGLFAAGGRTAPDDVLVLDVAGRGGIPEGVDTVTVNMTAVAPFELGYATVFPCLDDVPLAASLNHVAGVNGGNELIAEVDDQGRICVYTSSGVHLTADISGYTVSDS